MSADFYSIVSWVGMALLILAYLLSTFKKLKFDSIVYNLINSLGGIGLLINAFFLKLFPWIILTLFWVAAALVSLGKNLAEIGEKSK